MGTTAQGIPYPEPTDPIANGAVAIRTVAEALAGKMAEGVVLITPTAVNVLTTVAITFPVGRFTTVPHVIMQQQNVPSVGALQMGASAITTSGCNLGIWPQNFTNGRYYAWIATGK